MFENVVVAIRLYLALLWWKICRFLLHIAHTKSLKPTNQYFHKVVVVGDDFAAGIGDYITIGNAGGLAQYLSPLISRSDKVWGGVLTLRCLCANETHSPGCCSVLTCGHARDRCVIDGKSLMRVFPDRHQQTGCSTRRDRYTLCALVLREPFCRARRDDGG